MAYERLPQSLLWSNSLGSYQLNATDRAVASIYRAKKAGTITHAGILCQRYGASPTWRVGIESVASREPTGTYLASGAAYGDIADPPSGPSVITLGSPVSVTEGDQYAVSMRYLSGSITSNLYINDYYNSINSGGLMVPFISRKSGSTWSSAVAIPAVVSIYDDGELELGAHLLGNPFSTGNSWSSSGSPLYRGQGMTMASTRQCIGALLKIRLSTSSSFNIHLWKEGDPSPLRTTFIDAAKWAVVTFLAEMLVSFVPVELEAGSTYFFVIEPPTANAIADFPHWIYYNDASLKNANGSLFGVTGVAGSPPTWTKYGAAFGNGFRRYFILPEFDDVDAGGGGYSRSGRGTL